MFFFNYHPFEVIENVSYNEEIKLCLGFFQEYRGLRLGVLFEQEFCEYLLNLYKQFNEVVVRIEDDNLVSINAALRVEFVKVSDNEYHFKRRK